MSLKVSIVIPCRNEEKYIAKCIDSVLASDYPNELLEIFVCDGVSDDATPSIVKDYSEQHQGVKYLLNEKQTTPYALNLGITQSTGDVIIILGAHSELAANYIKTCVDILNEKPDVSCVGGVLKNHSEDELTQSIAAAMSSSFGVGSAHFRTGIKSGYVDTVAFGAYRRDVFEQIGLFDAELTRNQDDEFNYRMTKHNMRLWLSNNTSIVYHVRSSFKKLLRQYYQYGYWKVYVNRKHKAITTFRQLVPLFFVLFILMGAVVSLLSTWLLVAYLLTLGLYLGLALMVAAGAKVPFSQKPAIVLAFLCIHLSYGTGYLLGIIDFMLLGKNKPSESQEKLSR